MASSEAAENPKVEVLESATCSLRKILTTLGNTQPGSNVDMDTVPVSAAVFIIVATLQRASDDYNIVLTQAEGKGQPSVLSIRDLAGALRRLGTQSPHLLALALCDVKSSAPLTSVDAALVAHQLRDCGIPAVVVLPSISSRQPLLAFANELHRKIANGAEEPIAAQIRSVWAKKEQPVVVVQSRSGMVWRRAGWVPVASATPQHTPRVDLEARYRQFSDQKHRSVIIGPLYNEGHLFQWLGAPIESLSRRLGSPMHPEDTHRDGLLGSYVQTMIKSGDRYRPLLEALWFASWYETVMERLRRQKEYLKEPGEDAPDIRKVVWENLKKGIVEFPQPRIWSPETLEKLSRDPSEAWAVRNHAEEALKNALRFLHPRNNAKLWDKTAYGKLAQLDADLYISFDPMPFLEYALIERGRSVLYTILPWFKGAERWTRVIAHGVDGQANKSKEAKLIYLCGAIHDPASLLLTNEEIYEGSLTWAKQWNAILADIGVFLGTQTATLFLGIEPHEPFFRQLLRSLFLDSSNHQHTISQMIVTPMPGDLAFARPEQAAVFLKDLYECRLVQVRNRIRMLASGAAQEVPGGGTAGISLHWGSPLHFIEELVKRMPPELPSKPTTPSAKSN
jgi:hypothetical protein